MLGIMENVSVFEGGNEYNGTVLGLEGDEFWLLVRDLKEIHRGHVVNLYQLSDGKKFLSAAEWITRVEDVFTENGEFNSDVFWASKDPEAMIKLLETYRVIDAFKPSDA